MTCLVSATTASLSGPALKRCPSRAPRPLKPTLQLRPPAKPKASPRPTGQTRKQMGLDMHAGIAPVLPLLMCALAPRTRVCTRPRSSGPGTARVYRRQHPPLPENPEYQADHGLNSNDTNKPLCGGDSHGVARCLASAVEGQRPENKGRLCAARVEAGDDLGEDGQVRVVEDSGAYRECGDELVVITLEPQVAEQGPAGDSLSGQR